jgi:hypothetical protein
MKDTGERTPLTREHSEHETLLSCPSWADADGRHLLRFSIIKLHTIPLEWKVEAFQSSGVQICFIS